MVGKPFYIGCSLSFNCCLWIIFQSYSLAQVTPDRTLAQPSQVNLLGNEATITGGTSRGQNLFHSFSQFSIPNGSQVSFDNGRNIQRIFSRVTGRSASIINGSLKANGTADLFLINPNGLMIGPSASLNIGGSFIGTTANSIRFFDNTLYSVTPSASTQVSLSLPTSLLFNGGNGRISVRGNGHNINIPTNSLLPLSRNTQPTFQISPEQTLALVGSDIQFSNGVVTADSGHINLGGVQSGVVSLAPSGKGWALGYGSVLRFGDVSLSNRSLVDTSGSKAGQIHIQGNNITLADNSLIHIQHQGEQLGDSVQILATGQLSFRGSTQNPSTLNSNIIVENIGSQNSGGIRLTARELTLTDASRVESYTFGLGKSADILVNASESVTVSGALTQGGIGTFTNFAPGNAGDLTLFTKRLNLINGGFTSSQANFSSGASGNVKIHTVEQITISGTTRDGLLPSVISTTTVGSNNAGNLTLKTSDLVIKDGASISTSTVSQGDAGDIKIFASNSVDISGFSSLDFPSNIRAAAPILPPEQLAAIRMIPGIEIPDVPAGESGSILIQTPSLRVRDGAQITVSNFGTAAAGNIVIIGDDVNLSRNGQLNALTQSGLGGNVRLKAKNLTLDQSFISADSLSNQAGNISLDIQNLLLLKNSSKVTTSSNSGLGGNININSKLIVAFPTENSDIFANAKNGPGGRIRITTQEIFGLMVREELTDLSDITAISEADPQLNGVVEINTPEVDPSENLSEQPETVESPSEIARGCKAQATKSSFVNKGRGGLPQNPATLLSSRAIWQDLRAQKIQAAEQPISQTTQSTQEVSVSVPSKWAEAKAWQRLPNGKVKLVANAVNNNSSPPTASC